MSDPRCKCPMAISMTGDGCRYCQPQEHIDRMDEWLNEDREEIDRLQAENEDLVHALDDIANIPIDPCSTKNDYRLSAAKAIANVALAAYHNQGDKT